MINVAIGIVRNQDKHIYLTRRSIDQEFAGFLEFPGGKVDASETIEQALIRELKEEIGIHPTNIALFDHVRTEHNDKVLFLHFYLITQWQGVPFGREGQQGFWIAQHMLEEKQFPLANKKIIQRLLSENQ